MEEVMVLIRYATLPAGLGGLALFVDGLRRGHYRNNRLIAKCTIEIVGGMLVGSVFAMYVFGNRPFVAFCVGLAWSSIIQLARSRITKVAEAVLGEIHQRKGG